MALRVGSNISRIVALIAITRRVMGVRTEARNLCGPGQGTDLMARLLCAGVTSSGDSVWEMARQTLITKTGSPSRSSIFQRRWEKKLLRSTEKREKKY